MKRFAVRRTDKKLVFCCMDDRARMLTDKKQEKEERTYVRKIEC